MKHFYGESKKGAYFEGWYLKHQAGTKSIALIPAFHRDERGKRSASIQVIADGGTWFIPYPAKACLAASKDFFVRIGNNVFSTQGLRVNLKAPGLHLSGSLRYGPFTPLKGDIMGPFAHLPFMQCRHGIVSLSHSLTGSLLLNGEPQSFSGGTGYIEKDRGTSFPRSYLWTQCGWRHGRHDCCLMLSVADIPFYGVRFTGCICCIYYGGVQYRLATYLGAKVQTCASREVTVRQGSYLLKISLLKDHPQPLRAPELGSMARTIHESVSCTVRCQFYRKSERIFDVITSRAGFEAAGL